MWRGPTDRRAGTPAPLAGILWTTRLRFDARESVSACHREACESRSDVLSGVQRGQASAGMAGRSLTPCTAPGHHILPVLA
jgi:hypothetical protein